MKSLSRFLQAALPALAWMIVLGAPVQAQAPPSQQFGKAMKENAAELRRYPFKQRTEVSIDGEVRSVRLDQVRFDLDGNLERTQLTPAAKTSTRVVCGARWWRKGAEKLPTTLSA